MGEGFLIISDKKGNYIYKFNEKKGEYTTLDIPFNDVSDIYYSKGIII